MKKKVTWEEFVDRVKRGDEAVLANDFSVPLPDAADAQMEMLARLLPLLAPTAPRASHPAVSQALGMLVQKMGAKPEVEKALRDLYQFDEYSEGRLNQLQGKAALGLLGIGTKSALAPLVERAERVVAAGQEISTWRQNIDWKYPIEAIARGSKDLLATAKEYATPKRMATPLGRQLALELLWKAWNAKTRSPASDEAWASYLVTLWGGPFSQYARDYLLELPEALVLPRLREKLGPPRVAKAPPASPKWLARYEKGEHEAVWNEMRAIGQNAFEVPEVMQVARATMTRVKQEIERIGAVLTKGKYRFHAKKKWHLPPTDKTPAEIAKLEKSLGVRMPLSLRAFVEIVGSVDLSEEYDHDEYDERAAEARGPFAGLGRLDPLEVIPAKEMLEVSKPYVVKKAAKGPPELAPVGVIQFGYSPVCKHTGEDPDPMYRVELRFFGADAPVLQAGGPPIELVDYLRATIGAGGFRELLAQTGAREKRQREALCKGAISF